MTLEEDYDKVRCYEDYWFISSPPEQGSSSDQQSEPCTLRENVLGVLGYIGLIALPLTMAFIFDYVIPHYSSKKESPINTPTSYISVNETNKPPLTNASSDITSIIQPEPVLPSKPYDVTPTNQPIPDLTNAPSGVVLTNQPEPVSTNELSDIVSTNKPKEIMIRSSSYLRMQYNRSLHRNGDCID